MIKNIFHKAILLLFFSAVTTLSIAQSKTTNRAGIDKNKILIGEPTNLNIEIHIPLKEPLRFLNIDSIPHFELLEKQKIDTLTSDNSTMLKQTIRITSFDSGHWVIPAFVLERKITTDTIPVDVGFSNFDPSQDYHDIKDIIEVHPVNKKNWLWYLVGGILILVFSLGFFLRKKKHTEPIVESFLNPYEEAMEQLGILKKKNLLPKQYYSELVDIFRLYIFKTKRILSLQKTTADLILQLEKIDLDKDSYHQLSQALRLSDFVKFAKYIPSQEDNMNVFETIKNSIIIIEQSGSKTSP